MVPDITHKFQIICLRRTNVIEWKLNQMMDVQKWDKLNAP